MDDRLQHLTLVGVGLFACLAGAYGGWVMLALANGRALSLGELQLGFLALLGGTAAWCFVLRVIQEQISLYFKKKRARSRSV